MNTETVKDPMLPVDAFLASEMSSEQAIISIHDKYFEEWQKILDTVGTKSGKTDFLMNTAKLLAEKIVPFESEIVDSSNPDNDEDPKVIEKQGKILIATCSSTKFMNVLTKTITNWSKRKKGKDEMLLGELLTNLHFFFVHVMKTIPYLGKDVLVNPICICIGAITLTPTIHGLFPNLLEKFTALQKTVQEINKKNFDEEQKKTEASELIQQQNEELMHSVEPPENFRELSIFPTLAELTDIERPFLRANKVKGPYRSSEHYLDTHFRLLREDFMRPLRKAVQNFLKNKEEFLKTSGKSRANRQQDAGVRFYGDITFHGTEKSRDDKIDHFFNLPQQLVRKIRWDKSKRLLPGSLVMLSSDYCKTAIFAITLSPPFNRNTKFSGGDSRRRELSQGILRLSIETGANMINERSQYLMFECEAFFEAYRYNLGILQTMLFLENDGPESNSLNKFIVQVSSDVGRPLYLKNSELEYWLCTKTKNGHGHDIKNEDEEKNENEEIYVSPFYLNTWPTETIQASMGLDPDQYFALKTALTSELAVIQGPPGTGKTFIGLQIIKTLLTNITPELVPQSPILVLCYTNHALDQFLELLLKDMENELNIVRVGGQSKSDIVQKHTLVQKRKQLYDNILITQKQNEKFAFSKVKRLEEKLAGLEVEASELAKPMGIFNFHNMQVACRLEKAIPKFLWDELCTSSWLKFHRETFRMSNFNAEEIASHYFAAEPQVNDTIGMEGNDLVVGPMMKIENDQHQTADEMEDGVYHDMNELMEHRMEEEKVEELESKGHSETRSDFHNSIYFPDCSVLQLRHMVTRQNNLLEDFLNYISTKPYDSVNWGHYQSALIDKNEYENRANLHEAIFSLYNGKRMNLPNVDELLNNVDGETWEMYNWDILRHPWKVRWAIYFKIVEMAMAIAETYRDEVSNKLDTARRQLTKEKDKLDGFILRLADVIGMTTTGAAKMHQLLEIAMPQIVIVEEAAEILEAHVVTSLTEDCKHLILIGDHLQLKPSANIFELSQKFRLNVSLFERMILNGIPLCTLKTQHRMRPEISNLIIGPIYPELYDHPKVHTYPHVKGVKMNVFFISHHEQESTDKELLSKSNLHEAQFILGLCDYLLRQSYKPNQITILTTYTGQMFLLRKYIPTSCRGVRITCVDNFQGEENDIILLSLVRSNKEGKVGFVGMDNRICVALSRARHGLYIMGNMDMLTKASKTWRKINKKLKDGGNIGKALELVCAQHKNITEIRFSEDFGPLEKGGCGKICDAELDCGHHCPQFCHVEDANHKKYKCVSRCIKTCTNEHPCKDLCYEECQPCHALVNKTLACDHQKKMACSRDISTVKCLEPVIKMLTCGHQKKTECHEDVENLNCRERIRKILPCGHESLVECSKPPEKVKCDSMTEKKLPCGHIKEMHCHKTVEDVKCDVKMDVVIPGCFHVGKNIACYASFNPACSATCEKILSCGHACILRCHAEDDPNHKNYRCREKCHRICIIGHPCKHKHYCCQPCLPCIVPFKTVLKCGHEAIVRCREFTEGTYKCMEKIKNCNRKCGKGHSCYSQHACFEKCPPCGNKVKKMLACGHNVTVRCHAIAEKYQCTKQVDKLLPCNHVQNVECRTNLLTVRCKKRIVMKCITCSKGAYTECYKKDGFECTECESVATKRTRFEYPARLSATKVQNLDRTINTPIIDLTTDNPPDEIDYQVYERKF